MINDRLLYNYKMLYMAIVETAIKDYIAALKMNNKDKIRELEAFFIVRILAI